MSRRHTLRALLEKYEQLLVLQDAARHDSPACRSLMRGIAGRFPGALREWQALPPSVLQARLTFLQEQLTAPEDETPLPGWVQFGAALHAWLRLLLLLRQHGLLADSARPMADWLTAVRSLTAPDTDRSTEASLLDRLTPALRARAEAPPRGQLSQLAYEQVAVQFGVSVAAVKDALFGDPVGSADGI